MLNPKTLSAIPVCPFCLHNQRICSLLIMFWSRFGPPAVPKGQPKGQGQSKNPRIQGMRSGGVIGWHKAKILHFTGLMERLATPHTDCDKWMGFTSRPDFGPVAERGVTVHVKVSIFSWPAEDVPACEVCAELEVGLGASCSCETRCLPIYSSAFGRRGKGRYYMKSTLRLIATRSTVYGLV